MLRKKQFEEKMVLNASPFGAVTCAFGRKGEAQQVKRSAFEPAASLASSGISAGPGPGGCFWSPGTDWSFRMAMAFFEPGRVQKRACSKRTTCLYMCVLFLTAFRRPKCKHFRTCRGAFAAPHNHTVIQTTWAIAVTGTHPPPPTNPATPSNLLHVNSCNLYNGEAQRRRATKNTTPTKGN